MANVPLNSASRALANGNAKRANRPEKKKGAKRKLYDLHTWFGFHLAIIMSVVLFTGTVAVISNEIDWLIQDDMRVSPDGEQVSWNMIEASVRAAAPDDMLSSLQEMQGDHFAYRAMLVRPDGKRYYMHVNQWTGEVTGTTHPLTVQRFFRDLHRYLFMPSILGLPIVCAMAFVLALSLYTGLKTAGKLAKTALRLRRDKGVRILVGDLHKSAGIWASWFFVVIVVTGVWYLAEFTGALAGAEFEPSRPRIPAEKLASYGDVMRELSAAQLIAIGAAEIPNWRPTDIYFSTRPGQPATVLGKVGNPLIRSRANRVFIDPVDGAVIKAQRSTEIGWVAYLNEMADPLHFGFFGKLPTKIIWFLFGVAMTGLSVTGVWLTYRRLKETTVSKAQFATMPVILMAMVFGKFYLDRYLKQEEPGDVVAEAHWDVDDFKITSVWESGRRSGDARVKVRVVHPEGKPIIKSVHVANRSKSGSEEHALRPRSFGRLTALQVMAPSLNDAERAVVSIEFSSGIVVEQELLRETSVASPTH